MITILTKTIPRKIITLELFKKNSTTLVSKSDFAFKRLDRANTILAHLEDGTVVSEPAPKKKEKPSVTAASLFGSGDLFTQPVLDQLLKLDIMSMTPIEAISELYRLQEEAKQGGGK